ncbi:hypothetical protein EYF80_032820 [Liparis tanakae]|uniref:Uncharacterized protein n=1 Tax=Liparis tanakae TaxID=230148 RepID=A0A4Z2GUA6_9TELE|nr:hypothetical protein EYF80_032820 [Liparis tanakae]
MALGNASGAFIFARILSTRPTDEEVLRGGGEEARELDGPQDEKQDVWSLSAAVCLRSISSLQTTISAGIFKTMLTIQTRSLPPSSRGARVSTKSKTLAEVSGVVPQKQRAWGPSTET